MRIFDLRNTTPPEAQRFRRTLRALYGDRWKTSGARALDLNHRSVRRMAAGQQPIPPTIWPTLLELVRKEMNSTAPRPE